MGNEALRVVGSVVYLEQSHMLQVSVLVSVDREL